MWKCVSYPYIEDLTFILPIFNIILLVNTFVAWTLYHKILTEYGCHEHSLPFREDSIANCYKEGFFHFAFSFSFWLRGPKMKRPGLFNYVFIRTLADSTQGQGGESIDEDITAGIVYHLWWLQKNLVFHRLRERRKILKSFMLPWEL